APLGLAHVRRNTLGAEEDASPGLVVEEHRARDQRRIPLDRRKRGPSVADHPDRRVRGAEIKSTGVHWEAPIEHERGSHLVRYFAICQTVLFPLESATWWDVRKRMSHFAFGR